MTVLAYGLMCAGLGWMGGLTAALHMTADRPPRRRHPRRRWTLHLQLPVLHAAQWPVVRLGRPRRSTWQDVLGQDR